MIEINGKVYRNMPEQVQENMDDIDALLKQLPYNGPYESLDDIPEDIIVNNGTYLIGTDSYTIYKYNESTDEFISLGLFGAKGDKGETGATGATGARGEQGIKGATGTAAGFGTPVTNVTTVTPVEPATCTITTSGDDTAKVFTFDFEIPQGFQGEPGAKGDKGDKGDTGAKGDTGDPVTITLDNVVYEAEDGNITLPDYPNTAVWGNITGTLADQTDLKNALDAKQDIISDLNTIRSGASAGATAVQPSTLTNYVTTNTAQDITAKKSYITGNGKTEVSGEKVKITNDTAHPASQIRTTLDNNGILHEITDSSLALYEFAITTDYLDNLNTYVFSKSKTGTVAVTSDIPTTATSTTTLTPTTQTLVFTKADLSQESVNVITAVTASTTTTLS